MVGEMLKRTEFVVGVSGHRDLDPSEWTRAKLGIKDFLTSLSKYLPDTEILVMSGLADGADRLVSRVALDLGLRVVAALPMTQERYEEDFTSESVTEFRELLAAPGVGSFELGNEDRDACYSSLTDCLRRKSNILLTLWDGVDTQLAGGTSDTLSSFLTDNHRSGERTSRIEFVKKEPVSQCGQKFRLLDTCPSFRRSRARRCICLSFCCPGYLCCRYSREDADPTGRPTQ